MVVESGLLILSILQFLTLKLVLLKVIAKVAEFITPDFLTSYDLLRQFVGNYYPRARYYRSIESCKRSRQLIDFRVRGNGGSNKNSWQCLFNLNQTLITYFSKLISIIKIVTLPSGYDHTTLKHQVLTLFIQPRQQQLQLQTYRKITDRN